MGFKEAFDDIVGASENVRAEGDYIGEDGFLYCGKCHTPKQGEFKMPWGTIRPYFLCECMTAKRDREEEERKKRERMETIKALRMAGFAEAEMRQWTFDTDDCANERVSAVSKNYAELFSKMKTIGKGLLFFGDVGTGKTFAAACIVNALIDKGYPCLMTNFTTLINTISGMYTGKQEYIDKLNRYDLLVIDDLAAERNTEYANEIVYNVIDARYRAGLPLIITTNLTSEELKKPKETQKKRIYSRLLEMCFPVEVQGGDRRRKKCSEDFDMYKDMLGL